MNAGPVREQPHHVLGEKRSIRLTPPRKVGAATTHPNAGAVLGTPAPFAATRFDGAVQVADTGH